MPTIQWVLTVSLIDSEHDKWLQYISPEVRCIIDSEHDNWLQYISPEVRCIIDSEHDKSHNTGCFTIYAKPVTTLSSKSMRPHLAICSIIYLQGASTTV
jgi:hypothetical protein